METVDDNIHPDISWFRQAVNNAVSGSQAMELEQLLRGTTEHFSDHVALALTMLSQAIRTPGGSLIPADIQCLGLLWSGLNILIAAQSLLLRGFYSEGLIVARSSFENLAVSMYLHDNPQDSARFEKGEIHGKDCITLVKNKFIPSFGKQYGMLSEIAHQKPWYVLSFLSADTQGGFYYRVGGTFLPEHAERYRFCGGYIGLLAFHYCWFVELLIYRYDLVAQGRFWQKGDIGPPVRYVWKPLEEEQEFQASCERELNDAWEKI